MSTQYYSWYFAILSYKIFRTNFLIKELYNFIFSLHQLLPNLYKPHKQRPHWSYWQSPPLSACKWYSWCSFWGRIVFGSWKINTTITMKFANFIYSAAIWDAQIKEFSTNRDKEQFLTEINFVRYFWRYI